MKCFLCSVSIWLLFAVTAGYSADCQEIREELELPADLNTSGKVKTARWQVVDQILNDLAERAQDSGCSFRFDELFEVSNPDETYFPITNTALRLVPEESFVGLTVYRKDGEAIGAFDSRVAYQRSGGLYARESYTLHYFQFKDDEGRFQSSGNRLLLDDFLVRWSEIKNSLALESEARESASDSQPFR